MIICRIDYSCDHDGVPDFVPIQIHVIVCIFQNVNIFCFIIYCEFIQEPKQKGKGSMRSLKRKGIASDEDSPPRKTTTHRRMAVVYDSDEE